jgi:hypothetical protein
MQFKLLKYDISLTTKGHKSLLYLSLTIKNYRQELLSWYFFTESKSNGGILIYISFTEPNIWTCKIVFHYRPSKFSQGVPAGS